jgi:CRISPR-associated protein Cmr2
LKDIWSNKIAILTDTKIEELKEKNIHPLKNDNNSKIKNLENIKNINQINSINIDDLKSNYNNDEEKIYHHLWWSMPEKLKEESEILKNLIIDQKEFKTSMSTDENLSMIMCSIGPVQEFIAAGRKIIDLKVGSYLLSYLIFQGIKVIGDKYGYDSLVFPYMRDQYLLFKHFEEKGINVQLASDIEKEVASLPNVFTAIIPTEDIDEVTKEIEKNIKEEFEKISKYIKENIESFDRYNSTNEKVLYEKRIQDTQNSYDAEKWSGEWEKQTKQFPTFMYTSVEMNSEEQLKKEYKKLFPEVSEMPDDKYKVISEILGAKSAIRKSLREFVQNLDTRPMRGDDISASNKALIITKRREDNEEDVEYLSAISVIKRYFIEYLVQEKGYKEISKMAKISDLTSISKKYNSAILQMDGDKMGKWISGENRNQNSKIPHPVYQKMVSRTLNNFTKFVPKVVKEHEGILIYAGGDDVLAILPSNKVLEASDQIRNIYSGINDADIDGYTFKEGWAYKDGVTIFNMMGDATMSAGVTVFPKKFNLKTALSESRKMEKAAKEAGRNKFGLAVVKGNKLEETVSDWDYEDYAIIPNTVNLYKSTSSKEEQSYSHVIFKIIEDFETLAIMPKNLTNDSKEILTKEEYLDYLLPKTIEKRKIDNKEEFISYFERVLTKDNNLYNLKNKIFPLLKNIEFAFREGEDK